MKISVVVPTYNRPKLLLNCLNALAAQTFASACFEIIVVSDGIDLSTRDVVMKCSGRPGVNLYYYALETKKGPAAARNFGWRIANGRLIAFTDDDCLPHPTWLQMIWNHYMGEENVAFTGRVIVPIRHNPTDYALNTAGLATAEFITANCICTQKALLKTGGFDEQFTAAWREDSDLHFKLLQQGIPLYKNDQAIVEHPVRMAPWGVCIKEQRKSMFNALLYKKYPRLYRSHIQAQPVFHYYASTILFIAGLMGWLFGSTTLAAPAFGGWVLMALWFSAKRLSATSRAIGHIVEMVLTSMLIPFLSVYWTLYGSWKYRVLFF